MVYSCSSLTSKKICVTVFTYSVYSYSKLDSRSESSLIYASFFYGAIRITSLISSISFCNSSLRVIFGKFTNTHSPEKKLILHSRLLLLNELFKLIYFTLVVIERLSQIIISVNSSHLSLVLLYSHFSLSHSSV